MNISEMYVDLFDTQVKMICGNDMHNIDYDNDENEYMAMLYEEGINRDRN